MDPEKVREHVNEHGEFQSDKYRWCKPGFVPLKLTDPAARKVLLEYADLRQPIDGAFSDDLRFCIAAFDDVPAGPSEIASDRHNAGECTENHCEFCQEESANDARRL